MRRTVLVMVLVAVGACGDPKPVAIAPAPPTTVPTTLEAPPESALPPEAAPPEPAPEAVVADDPVPVGARPARARSTAAPAAPAGAKGPQPTGQIDIPAIGLSHATYEGVELSVLNYGPGHWPGTAMPGERGNTVFPGHRTTYTRPFWDIDKLVVGDRVVFTTPSGRFTYRVDQTLIVDDEDTWIITQTKEPTFTIFACHPKGSAKQRYVVKGSLLETARPGATTTAPPPTTTTTEPGLIPGLP